MATTCPTCGTENRAFAKFCIECIGNMPTSFAPTEMQPRMGEGSRPLLPPAPARVAAFATGAALPRGLADAPLTRSASSARATPNAKKGLWVSVAPFAIALLIGATGWMIAGASGWYIYSASAAAVAPEAVAPAVATEAPAPVLVAPAIEAAPAPAPVPAPVPVPSAPVQAPPAAAPKPRPTPVAAPARPATGAALSVQCAGLGFFAKGNCMAAQCAQPAHRQHPNCEAVRQQQRLMEEKRNPTLAN